METEYTYMNDVAPHMPAALKRFRASLDIATGALETGNIALAALAFLDIKQGAQMTADVLHPFIDFDIDLSSPLKAVQVLDLAAKLQAEFEVELIKRGCE